MSYAAYRLSVALYVAYRECVLLYEAHIERVLLSSHIHTHTHPYTHADARENSILQAQAAALLGALSLSSDLSALVTLTRHPAHLSRVQEHLSRGLPGLFCLYSRSLLPKP
jgi:hypothetical protein